MALKRHHHLIIIDYLFLRLLVVRRQRQTHLSIPILERPRNMTIPPNYSSKFWCTLDYPQLVSLFSRRMIIGHAAICLHSRSHQLLIDYKHQTEKGFLSEFRPFSRSAIFPGLIQLLKRSHSWVFCSPDLSELNKLGLNGGDVSLLALQCMARCIVQSTGVANCPFF